MNILNKLKHSFGMIGLTAVLYGCQSPEQKPATKTENPVQQVTFDGRTVQHAILDLNGDGKQDVVLYRCNKQFFDIIHSLAVYYGKEGDAWYERQVYDADSLDHIHPFCDIEEQVKDRSPDDITSWKTPCPGGTPALFLSEDINHDGIRDISLGYKNKKYSKEEKDYVLKSITFVAVSYGCEDGTYQLPQRIDVTKKQYSTRAQ